MRTFTPEMSPFIQSMERGDAEAKLGRTFGEYDRIVVTYSGGKDSLATVLHLLDMGVPREQIELWHHEVDEPGQPFMDWPCTPGYVRSTAAALGIPVLFSRRVGGFAREVQRHHQPAAPVIYETIRRGRIIEELLPAQNRPSTVERTFPALGAISAGRWCSAVLKIDVGRRIWANDPRFQRGGRFLYISGERREEGENEQGKAVGARAFYEEVEQDDTSKAGRDVTRWRSVIEWREDRVWDAIRRWRIRPHVGYELGWGRLSCAGCIFGKSAQFASFREVLPEQFKLVARAERRSGQTIKPPPKKRKGETEATRRSALNIVQFGELEPPFLPSGRELGALRKLARSHAPMYQAEVVLGRRDVWKHPRGAFKKQGGPS